jgi:nucleotide-binding universal stress UspA family protein
LRKAKEHPGMKDCAARSGDIGTILVPTDGSQCSRQAVSFAGDLAKKLSAKVHVLFASETNFAGPWYYYVLDDAVVRKIQKKGQAIVEEAAEDLRTLGVADVESHLQEGHPGDVIAEMAKKLDADLIVMGTHGRRGLERSLMGSVAREVANTTAVPLLLVR